MGNKFKDFLFPNKDSNEYSTSTIEIQTENIGNDNMDKNYSNASPSIFTPKTFLEVENVAIEIINNKPVIVDLTGTDVAEAKRICDFLNGVTYTLNGSVQKIAKLVYMFSPSSSKK